MRTEVHDGSGVWHPESLGSWYDIYLYQSIFQRHAGRRVRQAIQDWNAVQSNVQLAESSNPCSGGHCINTEIGTVLSGTCAASKFTEVNGIITGSKMIFPSEANAWNGNFQRRLVDHELGHHFGLEEYTNCATANSIMAPTACNATSGFPLSPTITDYLPVNKTVYGGGSSASCPVQ